MVCDMYNGNQGAYPDNWNEIAKAIKDKHGWRCVRCGHKHEPENGYCLTVHHLVPDKSLCEDWNLPPLCQKCHLQIQAKVDMFQDYFLPHSKWFKPYLEGFLQWKERGDMNGLF